MSLWYYWPDTGGSEIVMEVMVFNSVRGSAVEESSPLTLKNPGGGTPVIPSLIVKIILPLSSKL